MKIAAFEVVEISEPLDYILDLEPTGPISENFEVVGFESIYLLNNMGTLAIGYLLWGVAAIVSCFLKCFIYESKRVRKTHIWLKKMLFYNSLISLMLESYSLLSVCCLINFSYISFDTYGVTVHSVACIFFFIAIIVMPIFLSRTLIRAFTTLHETHMMRTYGHLYDELDLRVGKLALVQPLFFIVRRFMLAIAIVSLAKHLIFQIMIMSSQIVTSAIIIGNLSPFRGQFKKKIEMFNEVILMLVMYTIICFSPLVTSPEIKFSIGYISMVFVSTHLVVNFTIIGKSTFRLAKIKIFIKMAKRKHVK